MAEEYVLRLETAEPGARTIGFVPDDPQLLEVIKRRGETRIQVAPTDEGDTEGHALSTTVNVRAVLEDDDTEGHAISLHFPTREEADAFRRRLIAAGALTGAIAIGTVGAVGLANLPAGGSATGAGDAVVTQVGPMDVHEAPAFQAGAGAATQAGPMDVHEAPAFQAGAGAATQAGPMDVHEAPAFQADQSSGVGGERNARLEWERTRPAPGGDAGEPSEVEGRGIQPR